MEMDELRQQHARYGAGDIDLDYADDPAIPEGWRVVVRCWDRGGFLRSGYWDALIRAPYPIVGWRLADPLVRSRKAAVRRAIKEIRNHLAAAGAASSP
jgi:hypothetical protein